MAATLWKPALSLSIILLASACGSTVARAPVEKRAHSQPSTPVYHTVHRGDTLYGIAWQYDLDYRDVASWNHIKTPYLIYPKQRIRVKRPAAASPKPASVSRPEKSVSIQRPKRPDKSVAPKKNAPNTTPKPETKKRPKSQTPSPVKKAEAKLPRKFTWTWPAKGLIVRKFSQKGNKGLDISGRLGQPVYAAAGGRVVYSGSGLIGYGKLIIIKHNKSHLSAYAYNNRLLVKEGDTVSGGQRIAEMGQTGAKQVKLHFEIRRDGKPVNPLRYLPKS